MTKYDTNSTVYASSKLHRSFRNVGIVFAVLGAIAVLVPTVATIVVEQLIGWLLLAWGIAGLFFARSFKAFSEWKMVAGGFLVVTLLGVFFLLFPGVGASVMTAFLVVAFIIEGILSILMGLRMSGQLGNWQWIIVSGVSAFILGIIILLQWPATTQWVLGFLVGLNFLTTGISMMFVSRAAGNVIG
ncbi:MAG: DUF308 domain-containing protein [Sulfitobacter sp.]